MRWRCPGPSRGAGSSDRLRASHHWGRQEQGRHAFTEHHDAASGVDTLVRPEQVPGFALFVGLIANAVPPSTAPPPLKAPGALLISPALATLLLSQGVHARVVMETLGHSQVSLTLDTYSHVLAGASGGSAQRMQDAIGCQIGCQEDANSEAGGQELVDSVEKVVSQTFASWNRMDRFLRQIEALRPAASHWRVTTRRSSAVRLFQNNRND